MKKVVNALSWVSFFVILSAICVTGLLSGICVVNCISDELNITGTWWAFTLTPVLFIVDLCVSIFLCLGLKRLVAKD